MIPNMALLSGLDCENVLLRKDFSVALTGFSLAGTSSEVASRVKELNDHRNAQLSIDYDNSDVYGLGILLWEIAHEKRAFEDDYDPQLLENIINGARRPSDVFVDDDDHGPRNLPPD